MSITEPLFRFGVIADPQYAPIEPNLALNRYPANSLVKLKEAIAEFNRHDLAFVVTLGDIIDGIWESFDAVFPIYETLRHQRHFLLGNHDFAVAPERLSSVVSRVGMPAAHYDFAKDGYRFIALDGNDVSMHRWPEGHPNRQEAKQWMKALDASGATNGKRWNGAIGSAQFLWLHETLERAKAEGEKVFVLNHYPVFPVNDHNAFDSEQILDLLSGYDNVIAYFSGHNHNGNFGARDGTYFVNFKGMVDTSDTNAYAIVSVYSDKLEIKGFGREGDRTLPL
jgi:3',5'-cyclic AMP phosphodiesterase CpdA